MKPGVLVLTDDGHYGIVLSCLPEGTACTVLLGNGIKRQALTEELQVFPIPGSTSLQCFVELLPIPF
jgi:DNA repair exonuclease SbcCD nuclease subunit